MALSTLLPSSSSNDGDHSGRRRQHHRGKHKQKPVPPQRSSPPRPRTPPASHRAAAAMSKKPKNPKPARAKNAASAPPPAVSSSREQLKGLLSCRSASAAARVQDPAAPSAFARLRSSGGACGASLCAVRDVVEAASSATSSTAAVSVDRDTATLARSSRRAHRAPPRGGSQPSLRGLSGCYECRAINVEPMSRRYPRAREVCACPQCGEVFTKAESLEHHQAIRHAVSELGPEDSGRNIVEIIFKSSWRNSDRPICQVERILKVHNAPRTVARFEAYRDAVTSRCRAACAARAAADGNELLRFHSAPLACPLGLPGSTSLCPATDPNQGHACGVCTAVKHGFAPWLGAHPLGVRTTASSGRAHDCGATPTDSMGRHAMLVCRVIAGRVRRAGDATEEPFDSVAGEEDSDGGPCGNLEELFVANPMAILPCFVVVYRTVD